MTRGNSIDKELEEIEKLKKSTSKKQGLDKLERKKPKVDKKKTRTQDNTLPTFDNKESNHLVSFMLWHPFLKLFAFCALQQNHQGHHQEKAIFLYSIKHPRFHRVCRLSELAMHYIVSTAVIFFGIYSLYKVIIK